MGACELSDLNFRKFPDNHHLSRHAYTIYTFFLFTRLYHRYKLITMKIQASAKVKKLKYPTAAAVAVVTGAICSCQQSREPQKTAGVPEAGSVQQQQTELPLLPGIFVDLPEETNGVITPKKTEDTKQPPILGGLIVAPDTAKEPKATKPTVIPQGAVGSVPRQL